MGHKITRGLAWTQSWREEPTHMVRKFADGVYQVFSGNWMVAEVSHLWMAKLIVKELEK